MNLHPAWYFTEEKRYLEYLRGIPLRAVRWGSNENRFPRGANFNPCRDAEPAASRNLRKTSGLVRVVNRSTTAIEPARKSIGRATKTSVR